MSIHDYLEKLRAKSQRERERMAVIATGISFLIILVIWLVSFSEMNRATSEEVNNSSVGDQLEELKSNLGEDKQSIEEMMQNLPQNSMDLENLENLDTSSQGAEMENQGQDINQDANNSQENQQEIPSLP